MVRQPYLLALALGTALTIPAFAQDSADAPEPIAPETLTVKETIDPGPNVISNAQSWDGAGAFQVWSAEDLTYKGNLTTGSMSQMLISPDGATAYGQSTYMKRITHGDIEHVLEIYDVATLSITSEIALPTKAAMVAAYTPYLAMNAAGTLVYVQNATPATSVTVVDVAAGEVVQEVPTPGCFGVYPTLEGNGFSTACGDGSFASFDLGEDGSEMSRSSSEPVFDPDENPIFIAGKRIGEALAFITYNGDLITLDDSGEAIALLDMVSITDGVDEDWAPGGYDLFAYSPTADILFVAMHADPYDGSHKNASEEIWAYDVSEDTVLYRTHVEGVISLSATDEEAPKLYAVNEHEGTLEIFSSDPDAKFVLKHETSTDSRGWATVVSVAQ
ncbi:amine dehydrogenase large subunit [Pelagibacterium sp.]|uniref:amine dehydrogenase large subunit n=1 Tax=Pelagibacterium sp. TaxID=1967288 RepID=UPI003A9096A4